MNHNTLTCVSRERSWIKRRYDIMQTFFDFLKVAVQCHTEALHCHYLLCFSEIESMVPLPFVSSIADSIITPSSSKSPTSHSQLFLFFFFQLLLLFPHPIGSFCSLKSHSSLALACRQHILTLSDTVHPVALISLNTHVVVSPLWRNGFVSALSCSFPSCFHFHRCPDISTCLSPSSLHDYDSFDI